MSPSDESGLVRAARDGCACGQQDGGVSPATAPAPTGQISQPSTRHSTPQSPSLPSPSTTIPTRSIDVSRLPPPLPMVRILEILRELEPGQTLLVRHVRRPIHLYPKLEALGCTHQTTEREPGKIELLITRPV